MEKLIEILKHIEELYNKEEVSRERIKYSIEKNKEKAEDWKNKLYKYEIYDIIQAIDEYWRYKDDKERPRAAHIEAILNTKKDCEVVRCEKNEETARLARLAEVTKEELRKKTIEKWNT